MAHAMYICSLIHGKQPDAVVEEELEELDGDAVTASPDADVKIVFPENQNLGPLHACHASLLSLIPLQSSPLAPW
jgi:hypothetical protein